MESNVNFVKRIVLPEKLFENIYQDLIKIYLINGQ